MSEAEELDVAEEQRSKKKRQACTVPAPRTRHLIKGHLRVTDAWDQAILSNSATVARSIRDEKGSAEIEASLFIRSARFGTPFPARFPEISYPAKSGIHRRQSRPRSRALT